MAGFIKGPVTSFMWIPMAVFEVTFAPWLLIKESPRRRLDELARQTEYRSLY
jgi:hypothetical protein